MPAIDALDLNRALEKMLRALQLPETALYQSRNLVPRNFFATMASLLLLLLFCGPAVHAQTSVVTQHYDNLRSGANTNETLLTTANVNTKTFGKIFTTPVDGYVYGQPLYLPGITLGPGTPQAGTVHNVLFIATEHDTVYAFDADSNGGANASPLWTASLLDAAHGAAAGATTVSNTAVNSTDITPEIGITSTPVIDPNTGTIYVVGKTLENGSYIQRLHALDITTGAEKLGGPVALQASVPGTGNGSSGGVLNFDPLWENQRASLLLLNGIVYLAFGAHGDNGPWHGWVLAYNATTLQQTSAYCVSPNGTAGGVWMSGSGLAADVPDPVNHPFGRMFIATGNGSYTAAKPYTNKMDYGDSHIRLDLTNGVITVQDSFTPHNQATLNSGDTDVASGGILLLPDQASGGHTHLLVQVGKEGTVYLVDRDNMGGYSTTADNIVQELPGAVGGVWGMPAYWNNNVYFWGSSDHQKAFSLTNGLFSSTFTSESSETSNGGPLFAVSSNGATNGIVWAIESSGGHFILMAHDATNVATTLYSSTQNSGRDSGSSGVKFTVPTIVNGKVYCGDVGQVNVYGLLSAQQQAASPVFTPTSRTFTTSQQVTITDGTSGASIYYTTDGSTPTTASTLYSGPITVVATETIKAIASASNYLLSPVASATYTLQSPPVATPTFNPASGTYNSSQNVSISDTTSGATIYYTTNGSTPTTSSAVYSTPLSINSTQTIQAIAAASGYSNSAVASAAYTINLPQAATPTFNPPAGTYSSAQSVSLSDTISGATIYYTTNGSTPTTSSAVYSTPLSINSTQTIQAIAAASGYSNSSIASASYTFTSPQASTPTFSPAPGIYSSAQSVTISDATSGAAIYYTTNGSTPTTSSTPYTTAISVTSSQTIQAIAVASGYSNSAVGSATYTIQTGSPSINFGTGFSSTTGLQLNGSAVWNQSASRLRLTDTNTAGYESGSAFFTTPLNIQSFSNSFSFQLTSPNADGFTFLIQSTAYTAKGPAGGGLGYGDPNSFPRSVAVKFDLYNNAGEGKDSTGMYTNGATPTVPALDMTSSGVNLHSGDVMNVQMNYDGTTLSWTITDAATGKSFSASAAVNISSLVGGSTAFVGFTGATGGETVLQEILSWVYTPGSPTTQPPAATPAFNPPAGTYTSAQSVTLSDTTSGSTIYYTTNGSAPTTSSTQYTTAINVSSSQTIQAIAVASGYSNSPVASAAYTINLPQATAPTFNPPAGTYSSAQSVTLSDITTGATIYYTTNGSTPTTSSTPYTTAVAVNSSETIQAIAVASGYSNSPAASAAYTINLPQATAPTFNPPAGTYSSAQSVTLSDTTSGATIYYTTNGSTPSTSSTPYTTAITVSSNETIQAIAVASGYSNSAVASAAYTINLPQAAAPTFNPPAGTYSSAQSVTLNDTTSSATIYYTTNGSTPTTSSTKYTSAITVSSSQTIQAIAVASGYSNSPVSSASYTIQSASPAINFSSGFTSSTGLTLNGGASIVSNRLRLTDGGPSEARSAFFSTPVNIQSFTNNFSFQLSSAIGDGFTFVIQGDSSPTRTGPTGGGLGYGAGAPGGTTGIPLSVAVKFDIYNNNGEGSDSTGLYTNGVSPTIPSIDMTSSGVLLASGDILNVAMSYDGATLSWTITDTVTNKSFSTSVPLNLLNIIESPTAYVGFTASTGGSVATQDILSWSFTGTPISGAKLPIRYETESLSGATTSGPSYGTTGWSGFTDGVGTILQATKAGDSVTIPINVPAAATYDVRVGAKENSSRGILQLSINGASVGSPADEYSNAGYTWQELDLGTVTLPAGSQPFKFTVTGKNPASSAYQLTFDYITLIPQ